MPILYSFKRCPYAMRARMALYLSQIVCEHREVSLKNKPSLMLDISPKGTVPVLMLENGKVFEESLEIVDWCINSNVKIFKDNITDSQKKKTDELISLFDKEFKFHLDRYKYANRYDGLGNEDHRGECMKILDELNSIISNKEWILGKNINKLDISILPFIRQFRIADSKWFDNQTSIPNIIRILNNFLESKLHRETMINYKEWEEGSKPVYFPIFNSLD